MFCQEGGATDTVDGLLNKGVVGNTINISYWYFMDPGDVILSRYIYDGRNWVPATLYSGQPGGLPNEMIRITTTYSEAKDYRIAGGIVYRDASGQTKTFICGLGQTRDYLRIFESEVKNFGNVSLYYPETKTLTITGKNPYVGYFRNSNGAWRGDFLTYQITPNPSSKTWDWKVKEGYNFGLHCDKWGPGAWTLPYSLNPNTVGADLLPYPNVLPTQLTLEFTSPVFNPGQGTGAYAIYDYTNVVVYSRSIQGCQGDSCDLKCVPGSCGQPGCPCVTPTLTPTPPCPRNVYGYVQRTDGTKYPGAQVSAWSKSCINCSSENYVTTTTDNNGYWSLYTGQISSPYEVRIYEEQNAPGTSDSTQNPFLPGCTTISSIFDKNTVSWQSPSCTTCGPFIFYDTGNVIPTPTPIPANPYCSGAPCNFYPQGPYQEADNGAAGGSLSKDWSAYVNFTPSFSGSLNGVRVKVNVWTAGFLGCKITNSAGTVDLTPGESTVSLNTGVNQWPCISFPDFSVTAGTAYRLYCRNASWGDFRWRSNGGTETSTRTYAACIFPIIPTPTPACTKSCPEASVLLEPDNLQVISSPDVTLKWRQINDWEFGCPNTNTYKVYFANSFNGGNLDDDDPNGPDSVNPPTTQIAKTGLLAGNYYWQVKTDNNGGISCPTSFSFIRSFTITAGVNPWLQTKGGAIHANGTISSAIPACAPIPRYFSLDGDGGSPGLVSWQSATAPSLQDGSLSSKNWQAGSYPYPGSQQKFDYLSRLLGISTTDSFSSSPINISSLNSGVYYSSTARDISGSFPAGRKIVIFINGNTTVNNNIEVNQGDFFALIVKGNLTFKDTVTKAQGYFLADGQISTQTNGATDTAFEGQGSFIGWSGFDFNRNLGAGNCNPGETFIERPDFSYNAPIGFLSSHHTFQEVAP